MILKSMHAVPTSTPCPWANRNAPCWTGLHPIIRQCSQSSCQALVYPWHDRATTHHTSMSCIIHLSSPTWYSSCTCPSPPCTPWTTRTSSSLPSPPRRRWSLCTAGWRSTAAGTLTCLQYSSIHRWEEQIQTLLFTEGFVRIMFCFVCLQVPRLKTLHRNIIKKYVSIISKPAWYNCCCGSLCPFRFSLIQSLGAFSASLRLLTWSSVVKVLLIYL